MYQIPTFEGPFHQLLPIYIKYKRSLGHDYGKAIVYRLAEMNRFFINWELSEVVISKDMFEAWIGRKEGETASNQGKRYVAIHGFTQFLILNGYKNIFDKDTDEYDFSSKFVPYIYSSAKYQEFF